MKIFSEFSNELLNRREIVAEMDFEKNPGFENAKKEIANHFKANEELIVMKSLKGKFGSDSFLIDAFVYDSVEDKEKIDEAVG